MKSSSNSFQERVIHDPVDERKRKIVRIVTIVLTGMSLLTLFTMPTFHDYWSRLADPASDPYRMTVSALASTLVSLGCLWLVRKKSVRPEVPGTLVTMVVFASTLLADDFVEIAGGRSAVFLAIPLALAASLVHPKWAFVFAGANTVVLALRPGGLEKLNIYAIIAFWLLAVIIWLAFSIMEKAIETAQRETARVRSMLGIVSHELRTPLGTISGYADILFMSGGLDDMQGDMLGRIKAATLRLTDLVNRLLTQAHIQSGKISIRREKTSLAQVLAPVIEQGEKQAGEKGLDFEAEICEGDIYVDAMRVRQVFSNLVDNAIKYTANGFVRLSGKVEDGKLFVEVVDSGPGIPQELIPTLFQEFTQVQRFDTREYGGVGLGLSIVRDLVALMEGTVQIESTPGSGTCVFVSIPIQEIDEHVIDHRG